MSLLSQLRSIVSRSKKRVGRGVGSGKGQHTSGRGTKGQRARKSGNAPLWFEGGQLPIIKRMPMLRGKKRFNVVRPTAEITLTEINNMKAETITLDALKLERVIAPAFKKAKIVNTGSITRKVTIGDVKVTAGAAQAITKAGGSVSTN